MTDVDERPWMAGVYGPDRDDELSETARNFWIADVMSSEQDASQALNELAHVLLVVARLDSAAGGRREELAARVDYRTAALLHAARRMALCRAREEDPGPTYRETKDGLKHYVRTTSLTKRKPT